VAGLVKTKPFCSSALVKLLFKSAAVRCRMAASYLGIILSDFIFDLHRRGYSPEGVRHHVLVVEHFGHWLKRRGVRPDQLSTGHVREFLSFHLPRCHCPQPARKVRKDCRAPLRRLVEFLRRRKGIRECASPKVCLQGQSIGLWPPTTDTWSEFGACPWRSVEGGGCVLANS
jgi:hypothetical protein